MVKVGKNVYLVGDVDVYKDLVRDVIRGREGHGETRRERILQALLKLYYGIKGRNTGIRVTDQEWDYLLVLDACRYDMFEKQQIVQGSLQKVVSRGSSTPEWLQENFHGSHNDIVYLAGNPFASQVKLKELLGRVPFHHVEPVWRYGWDDTLGTVPPQAINEAFLSLKDQFPTKRFVLHYMQPHTPYIGPYTIRVSSFAKDVVLGIKKKGERNVWDFLRERKVTRHEMVKAYMSNLYFCLHHINTLLPSLTGKTVITADHGELFGRYALYEHPTYAHLPELIEVPWLCIER